MTRFKLAGVACAFHCKFQTVSVVCFAADFQPHPPPKPPKDSPAERSLALEKDWNAEEDW